MKKLSLLFVLLFSCQCFANDNKLFDESWLATATSEDVITEIEKNKNLDLKKENEYGRTPLMGAAEANNAEAVKVLLEYGSDVHQKSPPPSPMSAIAWLSKGAEMNLGYHIYPYQSSKSKKEVLELLINYGADINEENTNGFTPLHIAIQTSDEEAISFLLRKGARLSSPFTPNKEVFAIEDEINSLKKQMLFLEKNGGVVKPIDNTVNMLKEYQKSLIEEYQKTLAE